jgi:tRNA threonylcarbamoyladenosine biosynthesis protein TsaE
LTRQSYLVNEEKLDAFSAEILPLLSSFTLILLRGQMGAGKTRFVRALMQILGCSDQTGSPSFSIINEYHPTENPYQLEKIYHMDLYRLRNIQEAADIGLPDYLDGPDLCIIEWPELIMDLVKEQPYLDIEIEVLENLKRNYILTF